MSDAISFARIYTANPLSSLPAAGNAGSETNKDAASNQAPRLTGPNAPSFPTHPREPLTEAYQELKPFWNLEARELVQSGRRPLGFEQMITIYNHGDHQRIVSH